MRKTAYLSLGSNLGDRRANLEAAMEKLVAFGNVTAVSSLYETAPVEFERQPNFLNCAVALDTDRMPRQLLHGLLEIERSLGRNRKPISAAVVHRKGPRTIDVDIVLFGSAVIKTRELVVPHPAMAERRFVLEPLAEIAPEIRHPVLKLTMRQLRDSLPILGPWVKRLTEA